MTQRERFGKYEIIEVLGRGAMGVVYKGFDPGIDRVVAIKTIRKELIEDDERAGLALARFKNEARAAGRLSHPGIVAVYDYGESEAVTYIAMEYVQGNSLREYFNRGMRFAAPDIVSIMAQLLEALHHAHEARVWHRDIKPANLIIMSNGRLKIADFGIARIETSQLTLTGMVMGSPGYMAPEQYSGGTVDWRADLFAAGVVMHQLLTGQRLFTGTAEQVAYRICHQEAPPPSAVDPAGQWERYDALLARALSKSPDQRFQSALAFRDGLLEAYAAPVNSSVSEETIIAASTLPAGVFEPSNPSARTGDRGSRPGSISSPPPVAPAGEPRRSGRAWRFGIAAAAVGVAGAFLGGWWMAKVRPTPAPLAQSAPAAVAATAPAPAATRAVPASVPAAPLEARPPDRPKPVARPQIASRAHKPAVKHAPPKPEAAKAAPRESAPAETPSRPAEPQTVAAVAVPPPAPPPPATEAAPPKPATPPPAPSIWRDQAISFKVSNRLQFNRKLWSSGIQAEVHLGVVTLHGTVSSKEIADEAERAVAGVSGVLSVKNEIKVSP